MDRETLGNYLKLLEIAKEDLEYRQLCAECGRLDGQVVDLLKRIPKEDRDLLMDYIGTTGAANLKLVEIACQQRGW